MKCSLSDFIIYFILEAFIHQTLHGRSVEECRVFADIFTKDGVNIIYTLIGTGYILC